MKLGLLLFTVLFRLNTGIKAVQVIGGNITVVNGGTAILPCKLTDTKERLSQISWQRRTRKKPHTDNFFTVLPEIGPKFINGGFIDYRFEFIGSLDGFNGSLQLSNVTLLDEGVYTCIFSLFPSGNHEIEIPLNVLVLPVISVKDNQPILGSDEVALSTCTAAGSRPPAEVKWVPGTPTDKLRTTNISIEHSNGTATTVSTLLGIPSMEINHYPVTCVVTSPALSEADVLPFSLQVYFSPMEVKINKTSEHSFECLTEANPSATFTWRRSDLWPLSAVRADGPVLELLSLSSQLNGLYQCEATNLYGRKNVQLYVHVTSGACTACWVLLVLLFLLLIAGCLVALYYLKFKKTPPSIEWGTRQERHAIKPPTPSDDEQELEDRQGREGTEQRSL